MLSSILSDIASRMLTKTPEQDRVANFASAIANDIGREGTPFFEPTKDYIANKKIAFQLAKRYVDDYKKMQQDPEYAGQVRQDPAEFGNPKKDRQGRAKEDVEEQFESWANRVVENDELMIIDGKEVDPSSIEYDMQDYGDVIAPISAAKFIDGTDLTDDQMADLEASEAYITWVRNDYNDRAMSMADDVNQNPETEVPAQEGNEFALAVQKAKAAGMKPGDKFEVGGKEYTLKDAIEQAGMQLEEFFSEAEYAEPSQEHYKKACEAGFKGSYEDYKKEYASFPEEFPKNEASKPDFLDMDKDGDKTEPMKKAIKDKEAKEDTDLTAIKKLAGI